MRGNITHQGTVTTSISVSREEQARRAATSKTPTILAYPGGGDPNNLRIARNDMIMGWKKTSMGPKMPGRPQEQGWASFNGSFSLFSLFLFFMFYLFLSESL